MKMKMKTKPPMLLLLSAALLLPFCNRSFTAMAMPPSTRTRFLGATIGGLASFQFLFKSPAGENDCNSVVDCTGMIPPATCIYHQPPPPIDNDSMAAGKSYYSDNPSVFGRILDGSSPSRNYKETSDLLAFRDRSPKAELHALVIPKRYIPTVYSLLPEDVHLVQDMRQMGLDLLKEQQPQALATKDYILCFHIPPFNSVDHLHLHVLAPASKMNVMYRAGKYKCGSRWCISDLEVIERLQEGLVAVPYTQFF
ncbi:hypothetical protein ACHAWU_002470 [Discostella pseudostelligera]|uniref:HIT domain-containing protein n=1 Tax=Discostella pseudostelligera TaxID=259834 RepID=A0ABD3LYU8_9STRA